MLKPLFLYVRDNFWSKNDGANANAPRRSESVTSSSNNVVQHRRISNESENADQISVVKREVSLNGKVVYAEAVDSKFNCLFDVKASDENKYTVYLPDLKWNAIEDDKVRLIGVRDDNGKIDFTDMQPKVKVSKFGRVTAIEDGYAVFEDDTIMKFDAVNKYPILKICDEYKFEAIESDQKCDARHSLKYRVVNLLDKFVVKEKGIEFDHKPIKIYLDDERKDVNVSITRFITVINKSNRSVVLATVKSIPKNPDDASLIMVDKEGVDINYNLSPRNGKFKIYFKVQPKKIGRFEFTLVATFNGFEETFAFPIEISKSYVLPGTRYKRSPRFIDVRIDEYPVPQEMKEIDFNKIKSAHEELLQLYSELEQDLTPANYLSKMRIGIYLEEIALEKAFAGYHIERGVFETKGDCLKLLVKDVAEKRPSIIIGDKIIATDPFRTDDERPKYEAFIFKVECDAILCKFHDDFHKPYESTSGELPEFHKNHNQKEYTIDFHFSRSTFKRQQHALRKITAPGGLGTNFLFPSKKIVCNEVQVNASMDHDGELLIKDSPQKWFNTALNMYQKSAVINVLRGKNRPLPYCIFGCPGSGKTQTVVETIIQIFTHVKDSKIIVATPSNSAANLITEMLLESGVFDKNNPKFLRTVSNNQVERDLIPESLMKFCATVSIAADDGYDLTAPVRNKRGIWQNVTKSKIKEYSIIIGTLNCIGSLMQMSLDSYYTHVIIDEAGQSVEPETIIPLTLMCKRKGQCVLAGDPKQLGPILVSRYGKIFNFNYSMLERLLSNHPYYTRLYGEEKNQYDPDYVTKLKINYRSHPSVLKLYNDLFYNGELESAVNEENSPEALLLANSTENVLWKGTNRKCGIYFVNVENGVNRRVQESCSWYNDFEIKRIISFLSKCSSSGIPFCDIGIVTPYALQVKKLREQISQDLNDTDLKIGTVEEFQGQERMVMIVSTVRTNRTHLTTDAKFGLGFIQCPKRMNVAISRARALLIVFGKQTILESDDGWKQLIEYTKNNNTYVVESC